MDPNRQAFYARLAERSAAPLWEVLSALVTPEPRSPCRPHRWRWAEMRALLMEAGGLVTAKEAERRVLILENPGMPGQSRITTSLYAGLQLVMPGEVAPAHRHSQSALRFVLESEGAHTTVDGERIIMWPGDFVITPQHAWHDHGNETGAPVIWLDGLDIPLVQTLDASFAEHWPEDEQPVTRPVGYNRDRFARGLVPVDWKRSGAASPVVHYPYAEAREALARVAATDGPDPCLGVRMRYVDPTTGDWAMPTIGPFLQWMPAGFTSAPYRSTDATVYVAFEGRGRTRVGEVTFDWGPKDVFVVPSWWPVQHEILEEAVFFGFSDRPVQEKLGLFRERRGNA